MREGWTETTLGDVVDIQKGKKPPGLDVFEPLSKPYLTADVLRGATCEQFVSDGLAATCVHLSGNETVLLWDGAGAGDVFKSQPGILASTMAKVQSKSNSAIDDGYLYLYLDSKRIEIKSSCRGTTVPHVSPEALKSMSFYLPPLDEQKRIVDVLSSVDVYIDALQQQVGTARAARKALLHELLSAGGDDWAETTLGEVAIWGSGGTPKSGESAYYGGDIPWCVIGDLNEDEVFLTEKCITSDGLKNSSAKIVEPGAVLIAMYGASIGRTGMVGRPMATNQAIAFAYPIIGTLDNRFLLLFLQTQKSQFVEAGQGAAQPNISQTVLKAWPLTLPPLDEQKRIVEIVSAMDDFIQSTEQSVLDAKNLRSGLLSDLLSGEHEIPASYDSLLGAA